MDNRQSLSNRFFSVIDDLHAYYKHPEKNFVSIMTSQQTFELAVNLWTTFCNARDNYLALCQVSFCPPALEYPFLFFYRHPSNGSIHTVYSYPYELSKKSNLLSLKGFRYFLINVCNLPYIDCPKFRQLFYTLHSLIENYPYDSTTTIMNQLKMYAPRIAANLEKPNFFTLSTEKNLYFFNELNEFQSVLELASLTVLFESASLIPTKLLKKYFSDLMRRYKANPDSALQIHTVKPEEAIPSNTLNFQSKCHYTLHSIYYDPHSDRFRQVDSYNSYAAVGYQAKRLPSSVLDETCRVSPSITAFLNILCGDNLSLVDQFCSFLTEAALTDGIRFYVLYTKAHKATLQSFLSETLSFTASHINFKPYAKSKQRICPTLNQITKPTHLRSLFLAQSTGKCTVLVDDVLPSVGNLSTLQNLIDGEHISIKSDFAPLQHYNNRLCIVCVTDKSSTIEYLHKKELKAHILDFSLTESAASHPIEFNSADATWIYNTLIPYGLKLKTLKDQKISDPAPFDVQRTPPPLAETACIRAFFQLCQKQSDCCCDTHEVYQSYCQFLASAQNGRKTEFSKIQFNKEFRKISKSKFIYKRPHRSRKGPSPYCYIGLKLPEIFPQSEAAPSAPQEDCLMRYLKHIEKYQLTGQMKTTLDIPPSKK